MSNTETQATDQELQKERLNKRTKDQIELATKLRALNAKQITDLPKNEKEKIKEGSFGADVTVKDIFSDESKVKAVVDIIAENRRAEMAASKAKEEERIAKEATLKVTESNQNTAPQASTRIPDAPSSILTTQQQSVRMSMSEQGSNQAYGTATTSVKTAQAITLETPPPAPPMPEMDMKNNIKSNDKAFNLEKLSPVSKTESKKQISTLNGSSGRKPLEQDLKKEAHIIKKSTAVLKALDAKVKDSQKYLKSHSESSKKANPTTERAQTKRAQEAEKIVKKMLEEFSNPKGAVAIAYQNLEKANPSQKEQLNAKRLADQESIIAAKIRKETGLSLKDTDIKEMMTKLAKDKKIVDPAKANEIIKNSQAQNLKANTERKQSVSQEYAQLFSSKISTIKAPKIKNITTQKRPSIDISDAKGKPHATLSKTSTSRPVEKAKGL